MEIISHRGYWVNEREKNTYKAFERSFNNNFGTETDIRDFKGNLVISHDIANSRNLDIDLFLNLYKNKYPTGTLALNIKADGLVDLLFEKLKKHQIINYFVFDMSIPDTISYLKKGMNVCIRQSEYEKHPPFYENCYGIWLDAFHSIWYTEELIKDHLNAGKKVVLVSPELHNRDNSELWNLLRTSDLRHSNELIICTDLPEQVTKLMMNK